MRPRPNDCRLLALLFCLVGSPAMGQVTPSYVGDPAQLGRGIQRTMTLLASSTPERRNTVRILFYGQSITEQDWWKEVAEDLRVRWRVVPRYVGQWQPPAPHPGIENVVTLAHGLADEPHVLELSGDLSALKAVRVYSPRAFPCGVTAATDD